MNKIIFWLSRRIARRYARPYLSALNSQGLAWTLALIDEDIELYGAPYQHTLAKAGCIDLMAGWKGEA